MVAARAEIANLDRRVAPDLALHVEEILQHPGGRPVEVIAERVVVRDADGSVGCTPQAFVPEPTKGAFQF